ncbi:MAG: iron ABC transporter substrate-binding protein [Planctomycetes bacterium]|nr:iron ABC transporter substrate-binding protein [Planctomycetota bacterium]
MRASLVPLLALVAWTLPACGGAEYDLVVYASHDQEHSEPIIKMFEERTGLKVRAQYDVEQNKTVGLVNRLIAEKDAPQCDVFWNNEIAHTIRLKRLGLTQPAESEATRAIPAEFRDAEGHWVGFAARARVLMVDPKQLEAAGTSLPPSIWEMTAAEYAKYGSMAQPLTGTTLTHFAVLSQQLGREQVLDWLRASRESGIALTNGNATSMKRVCQGDFPWCLTDTDDAAAAIANGYAMEVVYPDQTDAVQGTLLIPNTACMIAGSERMEAAQQFIDYLVSPEIEEYLANSRARQIPLHPEAKAPEGLQLPFRDFAVLAVDWEAAATELQEVEEEFQKIFTQ